jgi:hypothetical protein
LLAASKQFSPFLAVPMALVLPGRRGLWVAAAVLIAMVVPFAFSDPSAFWRGLVRFHFLQGFRLDSLSLTALAGRLLGPAVQWVSLAGVVLGALVIAFCARGNIDVPLACTAAAVAWTAVLIWNKQSFCNYWWLASGLLGVAAAAPAAREKG